MSNDKYIPSEVENKIYSELDSDQKLKFNKSLQLTNNTVSKVG